MACKGPRTLARRKVRHYLRVRNMPKILHLYMDDSGTRHPDRNVNLSSGKPDWFGLGGVLVREEDEETCRKVHETFCARWSLSRPLHSDEIRNYKGDFGQFRVDRERRDRFFEDLETTLLALPVIGIACVIDRPGYHRRYHARYGKAKWSLCRSAFEICVERAAKFARSEDRKLNVHVERSDRKTDRAIQEYFRRLKGQGHSFDGQNAAKYSPLEQVQFDDVLYDFRLKDKSSQLMQFADLYLYPMCKGGYPRCYIPYERLKDGRKLIDAHVHEASVCGIKYYCFDGFYPKAALEEGPPHGLAPEVAPSEEASSDQKPQG